MSDDELGFTYLRTNQRESKPRARGITEIRGPYYTPMGKRHLEDVLETTGAYADSLNFAAGPFAPMPRERLGGLDPCYPARRRPSSPRRGLRAPRGPRPRA